jgi:hypothetical protein
LSREARNVFPKFNIRLYDKNSESDYFLDKAKADLLNQYFCSIISINDSNREPPNVVPRTHAILSNIDVNSQDVKDILQALQIDKACGDDGLRVRISFKFKLVI